MNRSKILTFLSELTDNPLVEVIWVDEALHCGAQSYLLRLSFPASCC